MIVAKPAAQELVNVIHDLETKSPNVLFLVNCDFNTLFEKIIMSPISSTCNMLYPK